MQLGIGRRVAAFHVNALCVFLIGVLHEVQLVGLLLQPLVSLFLKSLSSSYIQALRQLLGILVVDEILQPREVLIGVDILRHFFHEQGMVLQVVRNFVHFLLPQLFLWLVVLGNLEVVHC